MQRAITGMAHLPIKSDRSWFKQLFESSPDPTWIIDGQRFVECNEAAIRTLGYTSREELLNIHPSKLSPPRQADGQESFAKAEHMMELARKNGLHRFEWIHTKADGTNFVAEVTLSIIERDDREVIYCVWRDINERKSIEEKLRQQNSVLSTIIENFPGGISLFDADLRLVAHNEKFKRLMDIPDFLLEIPNLHLEDIIRHKAGRGEYGAGDVEKQVRERVLHARRFEAHQLEQKQLDGQIIEIISKPLARGGFISTYTDITERKRIVAELQESEARLSATFHLSPVPMGVALAEDPFPGVEFNEAWFRIFGRGKNVLGLSGTAYGLWVNPEQRALFMERVRDDGEFLNHEVQLRHSDGTELTVLLSGRRVDTGARPIFLLAYFDLTEQRRADQALRDAHAELEQRVIDRTRALRESEERFRDFAESSSDWLWETDADLRYSYYSERAAKILGQPTDALIGKTTTELATDEDRQRAPEKWAQFLKTIEAHAPFRAFDYCVATPDASLRQVRMSGKPVFSGAGTFLGYRGTGADITELVNAQNELIGAEKLAALGGLVAGIAHEINTPIGIGVTAASYLQEQTLEFETIYAAGNMKRSDMTAYLQTAKEVTNSLSTNLRRAAGLVQSFKQVAVDQTSDQMRRFQLKEYFNEILDSLRPKLKRTQHVIDIICPDELKIHSHPGAFSQILTNLIMNSLIHGFEHVAAGHIEIAASRSATQLSLRYSDNGCGMSPIQVKRVFEPFFTTRLGQGGSGLGMNIVYNLITQTLRGRIECRSTPGSGVQFLMLLPINEETDRGRSNVA
jgi:PAS domain S-box-containing protein